MTLWRGRSRRPFRERSCWRRLVSLAALVTRKGGPVLNNKAAGRERVEGGAAAAAGRSMGKGSAVPSGVVWNIRAGSEACRTGEERDRCMENMARPWSECPGSLPA